MRLFQKIFFLAFLSVSSFAAAQEDTSRALKEVEVNGKMVPLPAKSITPVQVLSGNNLENINGNNIADAVRFFSGVQIKDYGGIGGLKTLSVRSLGANHTGVSYNGIMLNDAQNGQIDLGKISLDNIEQVALYNAQPTNILQPARAFSYASVLDLKTKQPVFDNNEKIKLKASFKTGSFGLINPSINISHRWNQKLFSTIDVFYQNANGNYPFSYKDADTIVRAKRKNSDIKNYAIQQETKYVFSPDNSLSFLLYYYNSRRGLPAAIDPKNTFTDERLWDNNFFGQIFWNKNFGKKEAIEVGAKYNYSYSHYLNPHYLGADGKQESVFKQRELYFTSAYKYNLTQYLNFAVATDYFHNTLGADFHPEVGEFPRPERDTWLNNLSGSLSLRKISFTANILNTNVFNTVHSGSKPPDYHKYMPCVAVIYQPQKDFPLEIRAFYKNVFRMPTFNDLYYTQVGNTNLKPEFAKQYNLGITWKKYLKDSWVESYHIIADAYYNKVSDKIVAFPRQNLFQWSMLNYGKVDVKGLDINGQIFSIIGKYYHINVSANYTYQKALDVTNKNSASYKSQIPYTPVNSGSLNLSVEVHNILVSYSGVYSGYRYLIGQNSYATYLPSWNEHDIKLAYTIRKKGKGNWKIIFDLNNIFNQQYQVVTRYPMPGRNFAITLKYFI